METVGLTPRQEKAWTAMSQKMKSMSQEELKGLLSQTELAHKNLKGDSFIQGLQIALIKSHIK